MRDDTRNDCSPKTLLLENTLISWRPPGGIHAPVPAQLFANTCPAGWKKSGEIIGFEMSSTWL